LRFSPYFGYEGAFLVSGAVVDLHFLINILFDFMVQKAMLFEGLW